jgi:ATP-dependent DNA helicase RecQ
LHLITKNEEAFQVRALTKADQAKLIQTNDSFNLYNLAEVRFFLNELKLDDEVLLSVMMFEKCKGNW